MKYPSERRTALIPGARPDHNRPTGCYVTPVPPSDPFWLHTPPGPVGKSWPAKTSKPSTLSGAPRRVIEVLQLRSMNFLTKRDGIALAVGARALIHLAKTSQCSGRAGMLRFAAFGGLSVAEVGAVVGLGGDLSVVRSAQLMAAEATTALSDIGVGGRVNHQISSLAVLSPNLSWCTFSLSSNASIRLDIWVCGANFKCRPPCNCPLAPPATTMGSGS